MPPQPVSSARQDALRGHLVEAVSALQRRSAAEIGDDLIEELVAMSWLEWAGGTLRLTSIGQNICAQLREGR